MTVFKKRSLKAALGFVRVIRLKLRGL